MKRTISLRARITLICAAVLAICCILLTISNNLSAVQMADQMNAAPILPPQAAEGVPATDWGSVTAAVPVLQQAQKTFHAQSLLAMAVILGIGLLAIHRLVGRALAPLHQLSTQIQDRTVQDLARPLPVPNSGDEVTELAQSFNVMSARLDRAFVMQRSFSQNAAHELRTPLAVLKMRTELFRKKQDLSPQATGEFLTITQQEVDRLSGMVDSLLKLTNLEQVPRTDRIAPDALLRQVAEDAAPLASGKGVTFTLDAAPCSLTGSGELLRRALFNLAENAVKYGPEGGEVLLAARPAGGDILLSVTDQGPGIPSALRERIFEPFFRVDTARSRELGGAGLGLALVRAIAEVHGGSVCASEDPQGRNQFILRLPTAGS